MKNEQKTASSALFKKSVKLLIPALLLVVSVIILYTNHFVTAQQPVQSLEVSPPVQDITIDPGKKVTIKAKVRNPGDKSLPITARIENFIASGEEGQISLTADKKYAVSNWTKLSPTSFTLGPGEEKEVTAVISIPTNAAGARYGTFVFGIDTGESKKGSAAVSQQIASLFLVRIIGPATETVTLTRFSSPQFLENGPIPFSLSIKNTGNVHTKVYGLVNVTNVFGQKVADLVVQGTNILPDATRLFPVSLNKTWLFGPFTATAILYYGGNNPQTITATTTFFVFPVKITVAIIIVLALIFILRKRLKKAVQALISST